MMHDNRMKAARKNQGLTQAQVAQKVGISIRAYKMYESGERIPRADVAILIADTIGSNVKNLFGNLESREQDE